MLLMPWSADQACPGDQSKLAFSPGSRPAGQFNCFLAPRISQSYRGAGHSGRSGRMKGLDTKHAPAEA
eukprot:355617-Chlamydomonas_euryale.AAC.7